MSAKEVIFGEAARKRKLKSKGSTPSLDKLLGPTPA